MATKAELEAELAQLRLELKEIRNSISGHGAPTDTNATESADQPRSSTDTNGPAPKEEHADLLQSLQDGNFEGVIHQLIEELEGLPNRKPLLLAFGALAVGYLIGRSGSKG